MTGNSFCINCGTALVASSKYCGNCGHLVGGEIENQIPVSSEKLTIEPTKKENQFFTWACLTFGFVVGITALISVFELPAEATYITFNLTLDKILNGGWYTWYSGTLAFSMKTMIESGVGPEKSGMDASTFRTIHWLVIGLCVGLSWPAFKSGLRNFIKDVTR